jgi:hypothetical protein
MAVVTLGTTKQPLPGFTGRVAAPKEHGEMGYNYELAAAMPPVSDTARCHWRYCPWCFMLCLAADNVQQSAWCHHTSFAVAFKRCLQLLPNIADTGHISPKTAP